MLWFCCRSFKQYNKEKFYPWNKWLKSTIQYLWCNNVFQSGWMWNVAVMEATRLKCLEKKRGSRRLFSDCFERFWPTMLTVMTVQGAIRQDSLKRENNFCRIASILPWTLRIKTSFHSNISQCNSSNYLMFIPPLTDDTFYIRSRNKRIIYQQYFNIFWWAAAWIKYPTISLFSSLQISSSIFFMSNAVVFTASQLS